MKTSPAVVDMTSPEPGSDRRLKASEVLARRLVDFIHERRMKPGDRLPAERDMIAQMEVARSTVREALRLLETRGVITIKPGPQGGPVVRIPRPTDLTEPLTLLLQFQGSSLLDVLEARLMFEPALARMAASRISDEEVDILRVSVDEMLRHPDRHNVFIEANRVFHSTITAAARNGPLLIFMDTLKNIADGSFAGIRATPERRNEVARAHLRIVEALQARLPEAAEEAMAAHLKDSAEYWRNAYAPLIYEPMKWLQ